MSAIYANINDVTDVLLPDEHRNSSSSCKKEKILIAILIGGLISLLTTFLVIFLLFNSNTKEKKESTVPSKYIEPLIDEDIITTLKQLKSMNKKLKWINIEFSKQFEKSHFIDLNEDDLDTISKRLDEVKSNLKYCKSKLPQPPHIITEEELEKIINMTPYRYSVYKRIFSLTVNGFESLRGTIYQRENLIFVIKDKRGFIFGGFCSFDFYGLDNEFPNRYLKDEEALLFNLNTEKTYKVKDQLKAMYIGENGTISFGNDLVISKDGVDTNFPNNYGNSTTKEFELTMGYKDIQVEEIQIFEQCLYCPKKY